MTMSIRPLAKRTTKSLETKTFGLVPALFMIAGGLATLALLSKSTMPWWPQAWGTPPSLFGVVLAVGLALSLIPYTLHWWRGLDEGQQEAHKWAWWWGGNLGLSVGSLGFIGLSASGYQPLAHLPAALLLLIGFGASLASQAIGYALAWGLWWMQRQ